MEKYKIVKKDNIEYLQFERLLEFDDDLAHAIFLKKHGIAFDLDKDNSIRDNSINIVKNEFGIANDIIQSFQIHSDNIKIITKKSNKNILKNYDGYITSSPEIATITTFADCIPVFIYDPKRKVYANIHSGWRGVVNRISIKAIELLHKKYQSNVRDLICCIGPNIGKECFLVNDDLVEIYNSNFSDFIKKYPIVEKTEFLNSKGIQSRIDNNLLLKLLLKEVGILEKNIINSDICTVCNSADFHSRRVEGEDFQRGGGLMMLK